MVLGGFGFDKGKDQYEACSNRQCRDPGLQMMMLSLYLLMLGFFMVLAEVRHPTALKHFSFLRFPVGRG